MADQTSEHVADVILEDQLVDIWPEYPCLYDVRSSEFKNRDARDKALQEIAENLGQTGCYLLIINIDFISVCYIVILQSFSSFIQSKLFFEQRFICWKI